MIYLLVAKPATTITKNGKASKNIVLLGRRYLGDRPASGNNNATTSTSSAQNRSYEFYRKRQAAGGGIPSGSLQNQERQWNETIATLFITE